MDRRWFGVIVVAVGLLAAVVGPNLSAHRVAGSPTVIAAADPPTKGLCVTSLRAVDHRLDAEESIDYPSAGYGSCDATIVGEVSSVDPTVAPPRRIAAADYQRRGAQCALDAIGYTGSIAPVVDQGAGRTGVLWRSDLAFDFTPVGPDAAQRAAGQRWSACIVGSVNAVPFAGRLRQVLDTGILPPVFGSCWASLDLGQAQQIPCDQGHPVELLGSTTLGGQPIRAVDVSDACTVYAGRVLRTADPTRQGVVRIGILGFDQPTTVIPPGGADLQNTTVTCFVAAPEGRRFDATLVGIGERALPLI